MTSNRFKGCAGNKCWIRPSLQPYILGHVYLQIRHQDQYLWILSALVVFEKGFNL